MNELKQRKTEDGIDSVLVGDYYIPDLKLPKQNRPIEKFGRLHRDFLKEKYPASCGHERAGAGKAGYDYRTDESC